MSRDAKRRVWTVELPVTVVSEDDPDGHDTVLSIEVEAYTYTAAVQRLGERLSSLCDTTRLR